MEMVLSSYKIVWVEFRAQKGNVTKKDSKILMDSAFGDSYGKNARKHFASEESARKYLKEKAEAFKKLSKMYEVRLFCDKQYSMAQYSDIEKGFVIPFTKKQESEMFLIGNK